MPLHEDILVQCVYDQTAKDKPFVLGQQVRRWLSARGHDWGEPHGYRIKDAENRELASRAPRIIKWKTGPHRNSPVAFSRSDFKGKAPLGWRRIAPM